LFSAFKSFLCVLSTVHREHRTKITTREEKKHPLV